jgi:hypothetical protein
VPSRRRQPAAEWGPFGDRTLCAMVNDLRFCARRAKKHH